MTTLLHKISIAASPATVFAALSTVKGLKAWYAPDITGKIVQDGEFNVKSPKHETFDWKIVELKPESLVRWQCLKGPQDAIGTTVTFLISAITETRTSVECEHAGHPSSSKALPTCNTFWGILLGHLKGYAETSHAIPALA